MIFMTNFTIFYEISYKCPNVRQTFSTKTVSFRNALCQREKSHFPPQPPLLLLFFSMPSTIHYPCSSSHLYITQSFNFFSLVSLRNFLCCRENSHFCFEFSSFPVQCTILLVQITIYFTIRALLFVDFFLLVSF